ncbi:SulP family inorganic anion transporter [Thermithiobacillus plumbiphilus]|uniref:SulP family inorganic anion transporter n=1 Tax=Thermithiobacillus plumbiphilus TaxID=1729899 RepID=A0ABU9DDG2_9PROT
MFDLISKNSPSNLRVEALSGLTVALALVPEAVAFAFVAGVNPLVGLYAAFMVGLITAVIGGRGGMISGATGALAVVMVALVAQHGVEYLFATVVLMGLIQILAGVFKLGRFIRMVPHPVFLGFVNGLAIVIFLAQLEHFKVKTPDGGTGWMSGMDLGLMLGLIALTMAIMHFLPRLTRAVPSALAAIVVVTLLVMGLNLETRSVGDLASIAGGLPAFHLPMVPINLETLWIILPYSLVLAGIGLIESLLTMSLIDELTETRGNGNRVCVGQGVANTVTGFFGGMGGCAMVGQSMINVESGGRSHWSGIFAALFLLAFIVVASPLIEMIPLAALVGIMFMVVIGTFEWGSLRLFCRVPRPDIFVGILVAVVTVLTDLAIAVITGVIVSALVFAWQQAKRIEVKATLNEQGSKVYSLQGTLFFASVKNFQELFDPLNDPEDVIIDFQQARVVDHSGIAAIDALAERYIKAGKQLHLRHLSADCRELLEKAGDLVEVNILEDPHYRVAD